MTNLQQYASGPASAAQFCEFWSAHVEALERHLSTKMWVLATVTVVLIAHPIARIVIPAVLHFAVPDVVRNRAQLDLSSTWAPRQKSYARRRPFVVRVQPTCWPLFRTRRRTWPI